jgi:hypothetical protein
LFGLSDNSASGSTALLEAQRESSPPYAAMTRMVPQTAVTVVCDVLPARADALARTLAEMGTDVPANSIVPFARLPEVHFGRLFMTQSAPVHLVYMSDVDGTAEDHLAALVDVAGAALDSVFGHCAGYPQPDTADREHRLAFLLGRQVQPAAAYVNTIGRTVRQVIEERRLHGAIEEFLDRERDSLPDHPVRLRSAVRAFVAGRPDLAWALAPVEPFDLSWQVDSWLRVVPVALGALVLLPVAVAAGPIYLLLLRLDEMRDVPSAARPEPDRLARIAALQDRYVQNPFCAESPIKDGWLRPLTTRLALFATGLAARYVYSHGDLVGLKTIHFFRLLTLDGGRKLLFASSFDGSLEGYMDDFIDKIGWALNTIFGGAVGYPKTRFLVFGGAANEREFKDYVQVHQLPIPVFYSAYPDLTAVNVANNAALRAGLSGPMSGAEAAEWVRRL